MEIKIIFKENAHPELIKSLNRNMKQWLEQLTYIKEFKIKQSLECPINKDI